VCEGFHHKTDKGTFGNTWRVVLAENEAVIREIGWTTVAEDQGVVGDSAVTISRYTGGGVIASVFGSTADQMIPYLGDAIARDVGWELIFTVGLAQPGRYTLCVAERAHDSPWPALHVELGHRPDQSTVTVLRAESTINVTGGLDELASVIGSAASLFAMLHEGKVAALVAPHVARRLAREGSDKADVKRYLHARGRLPAETWRRSWIRSVVRETEWPAWVTEAARSGDIPAVRDPEDITVVVAGADLEIPQHAYFPSWGHPPCRVTREIRMPADWAERLGE